MTDETRTNATAAPEQAAAPSRPIPFPKLTIWTLALAAAVMLATTSCSTPDSEEAIIESGVTAPASPSEQGEATGIEPAVETWTDATARAIVSDSPVDVSASPGGVPMLSIAPATSFGTTRVLLVEEERDGWLKVRLPIRPNHQSGWIRGDQVEVEELDLAVYVDLETRTLVVGDGDLALLTTPVAIGTVENPTPVGTFYVTDKLETPQPGGAYGPFAFGLSGYSETLTEFAGGDGQIGIHGTDDPASIGQNASHGCIRVPNEIVEQLADLLPLGTPVHIV